MAASAGILMYRGTKPSLEVLLVHPGGPFWRNKDDGAWSIPRSLLQNVGGQRREKRAEMKR